MLTSFVPAFITLLVAVDPVGLIPLFISLTQGAEAAHRRRMALRASGIATVLLLAFAVFGDALLSAIGITLPAFRVAGGALLFLIALEMVFERRNARRARSTEGRHAMTPAEDVSVFPLAVPLICGPGAIASTILLMTAAEGDVAGQAGVIAALLLVCAVTLAAFLAASSLARHVSPTVVAVATRLLGMLLAALAVQFMLDGLKAGLLT